ncbi:flagellar basal body-associated FliL family protein [Shewanella submarina]|uniref:Flagellar protein FliL n=1 Tax=Shewanella submarina TaxID=2016376 RepID=A0ABV7GFT9_9GAMM|nr:flagellar basal body-associated FliL family protein [Shewanella submarina]MCL1038717.1 flagellar basal body-associated FliL family protein [Shewanella submarina]
MSFMKKHLKTLTIALGCSAGAFYLGWQSPTLMGDVFEQQQVAQPTPRFYPLERFIISVPGKEYQHYVLLELALKSSSANAKHQLAEADPLVRNSLMKMFAGKQVDELNKPKNLEQLQQEAKDLLTNVLSANKFAVKIDDVLFTRLVIQ